MTSYRALVDINLQGDIIRGPRPAAGFGPALPGELLPEAWVSVNQYQIDQLLETGTVEKVEEKPRHRTTKVG